MSSRALFQERLDDARRIHLDPSVIAYHLISHPEALPYTRLIFTGLRAERLSAQTSALSIYQLLAEPYRRGSEDLAERAQRYLGGQPGLAIVPVTETVARQAAEVQASLGGSARRSIQIATALLGGVRAYVARRTSLRRIAGMEFISLEDFIRA